LHLETKPWAESQIVSSSAVLLKEKEKHEQEETLKDRTVDSGQMAQKPQSLFKGQFIDCKGKQWEKSG
jgi:hypothetical protein